jgi:hypothetical protein
MDDQGTNRESGGSVKLLKWFTGLGILGLAMIVAGATGMAMSRDGLAIAGGIVVGSVAISVAMLATAKN